MTNKVTNNQQLIDVYMPISHEDAKAMGFKNSELAIRHIGVRNYTCVKTQGTLEFAEKYNRMLENEQRAEFREKRCLISDGKGGFIRCPECKHCNDCKKRLDFNFTTNKPVSLEKLTQGDTEEDKAIDIEGRYESQADILSHIILEDLIQYLGTFEGKQYDRIFKMLYDQHGTKEIADDLGLAWSTAKDAITKVRKLAQEFTNLTK